ncbi:MAG TPA: hypothetical protein EYP68_01950 [Candidatus Korarchaeota archaeon]|nr:hypothetical protein [Candidatus Korarchaeota archaeon]
MPTTITIPEELRRRIKRIASLLDIPQYKVLEMLLDLFESELRPSIQKVDEEVLRELENAKKVVRSKDKEWAMRAEVAERAVATGLVPELFRGRWGVEFELEDTA